MLSRAAGVSCTRLGHERAVARRRSVFLGHLFVAVFRVGNKLAALRVHYEVEVFQWNLAEQIRHILVNVHYVKSAASPLDLQPGWLEYSALPDAVGGAGMDFVNSLQTERLDNAGLEITTIRLATDESVGRVWIRGDCIEIKL